MVGLASFYGIQTGLIFPFTAPIMSLIVIFSYFYFLTSGQPYLSKRFYSFCTTLMLFVLASSLLIDFVLRIVAFDQTYCRGTDGEDFKACKAEHEASFWLDTFKIAAMLQIMFYSTKVLETFSDTVEKTELDDNEQSLL